MASKKKSSNGKKSNGKDQPAIGRSEFQEQATTIEVVVNGKPLMAEAREFGTGSYGFYLNGKAEVEIGGKKVPLQCNANIVVPHSKNAPQ